jgi:outer membrane protein OmpA-like peptidoglycan-associated protein
MSATLVNDLVGAFKSQALGLASARLGEPQASVLNGFETASAAILAAMANKAGESGFMSQLFDLIRSPTNTAALDDVGSFFAAEAEPGGAAGIGGRLFSMLFGDQQPKVTEEVGRSAGLRPSSAATLMGLAASMLLGLLARRVQQDHLNPESLSSLLQREGCGARSMLPASLRSMLGEPAVRPPRTVESPGPGRWLWPILAALILMWLLWFARRGREETSAMTGQARREATQADARMPGPRDFFDTTLPNGVELNIPRNGTEWRVIEFIQDPSQTVARDNWLDFDRLYFVPHSAKMTAGSQEQLDNIAAIMNANPNVRIKIGGFTDNSGDTATNMLLSQERAEAVRQQLISLGISGDRLDAQGYGFQYPVADNATEEGRARNRRVSLLVTQK